MSLHFKMMEIYIPKEQNSEKIMKTCRNSITKAQHALDHLNKKQEFVLVSIFSPAFVFGILLWMRAWKFRLCMSMD